MIAIAFALGLGGCASELESGEAETNDQAVATLGVCPLVLQDPSVAVYRSGKDLVWVPKHISVDSLTIVLPRSQEGGGYERSPFATPHVDYRFSPSFDSAAVEKSKATLRKEISPAKLRLNAASASATVVQLFDSQRTDTPVKQDPPTFSVSGVSLDASFVGGQLFRIAPRRQTLLRASVSAQFDCGKSIATVKLETDRTPKFNAAYADVYSADFELGVIDAFLANASAVDPEKGILRDAIAAFPSARIAANQFMEVVKREIGPLPAEYGDAVDFAELKVRVNRARLAFEPYANALLKASHSQRTVEDLYVRQADGTYRIDDSDILDSKASLILRPTASLWNNLQKLEARTERSGWSKLKLAE